MKIIKITTCYGETCFVSADALAIAQHMVPLLTKTGKRINEVPGFKKGSAHMLDLGNIEEMEAL